MDLKGKGKMRFLKDSKGEYVHNHKEEIDNWTLVIIKRTLAIGIFAQGL